MADNGPPSTLCSSVEPLVDVLLRASMSAVDKLFR